MNSRTVTFYKNTWEVKLQITYKPGRETGYLGLLTLTDEGETRKFWVDEENGGVTSYSPVLELSKVRSIDEGLKDLEDALDKAMDLETAWAEIIEGFRTAAENLYDAWCQVRAGEKIEQKDMCSYTMAFLNEVEQLRDYAGHPEEFAESINETYKSFVHASTSYLVKDYVRISKRYCD